MTKNPGIGAKRSLPVPKTQFERDLVLAIENVFKEIEDYLESLEVRIEALEP